LAIDVSMLGMLKGMLATPPKRQRPDDTATAGGAAVGASTNPAYPPLACSRSSLVIPSSLTRRLCDRAMQGHRRQTLRGDHPQSATAPLPPGARRPLTARGCSPVIRMALPQPSCRLPTRRVRARIPHSVGRVSLVWERSRMLKRPRWWPNPWVLKTTRWGVLAAAPRRPIEVIAFPPGDPRDNYDLEPVGRWMVPTADFLVTGGRYTHLWLPVYAWLRAPVHACRSRPAVSVPTALHYCQCVPLAHPPPLPQPSAR